MTPPAQTLLAGRYVLGAPLGSGGMADVYAGTDTRLGRPVAVKVLRADLARDPSSRQRFGREAQSAAQLNAPCIVAVYDTGEDVVAGVAGVPWIVMEHVPGRTLRDVLLQEGPLSPQSALEVAAEVCGALQVAHEAGIVHRDIKPGNVMLTRTGEVKVMDFGIARAVSGSTSTMTHTAHVIGTAAYLSPEQARGDHVDARSDLYSTGCLLYELLTGRPPFIGDSPLAVAYQHVREDPLAPSRVAPALSPDVDAVVLRAVAKAPADRYQTAEQMRDDLLRAAAGVPVEAPPPLPAAAVVGGSRRVLPAARRRGPVWALFALLLLAVALVAGLLTRDLAGDDPVAVRVPGVVGLPQADAQRLLTEAGLLVGGVQPVFDPQPVGTVLRQAPAADTELPEGGRVDLAVSQGVERTLVPALVGLSQQEAQARLEQGRLAVDVVERGGNSTPGTVLEVLPPQGTEVPVGQQVTLVVANGQVEVPLVVQLASDEAAATLQRAGLDVAVRLQDAAGRAGVVLSQDPVNTVAQRGSTVTIVVSRTPPAPTPPPPPAPSPSPTAAPTPTPTPSGSPTPTPTPSPTTPSPTPSATPTPTP